MIHHRPVQQDARLRFLLDGYRVHGSGNFLDELLAAGGQELDTVLQITVNAEDLIQRLLKRTSMDGFATRTLERSSRGSVPKGRPCQRPGACTTPPLSVGGREYGRKSAASTSDAFRLLPASADDLGRDC